MRNAAKRVALACLCALWSLEPCAAAVAPPPESAQTGSAPESKESYRVSAGDVVAITVFPVSEYSREVTVQPDGKVEVPLIGALLIKGLNAKEIEALFEQKYARFVANPKITVNVRRFAGRRVAIIGEVHASGYYEYREGMRVMELVALAGGFSDLAKPSHTKILKLETGKDQAYAVNLQAVLDGKPGFNPMVAPGDTIYVPKGRITQNAMWANVNILPWLALMTGVATLAVLIKTQ